MNRPIQAGDILCSQWFSGGGGAQFFEVLKRNEKTVRVAELMPRYISGTKPQFGYQVPGIRSIRPEFSRKVSNSRYGGSEYISVESGLAVPWDGKSVAYWPD